jgi:streptomycin 3"-adenylyltransferase
MGHGVTPAERDAWLLADNVTAELRMELGEDLVSVVVHGSLAMGCYHAPKADVDLLAVVAQRLTPERRRAVTAALFDVHDRRESGAGIEISVVTADAARSAAHPMPFEVHVGDDMLDLEAVRSGSFDYSGERTDDDLAAHITVARARGVAVFGPPPAEVFSPIPWRHYLDALSTDLDWALERAAVNPVYLVLNACRVLQIDALGEGTVMSKAEGGTWGLSALPAQYGPLIEAALNHYGSAEAEGTAKLDSGALRRFVEFVKCRHAGTC